MDEKGEFVVKVRGLPWSSNTEDIENFFSGCKLKEDRDTSINILRNSEGQDSVSLNFSNQLCSEQSLFMIGCYSLIFQIVY